MIVDRGQHDIVKPEWIKDSVAKDELIPLAKRCAGHMTFLLQSLLT